MSDLMELARDVAVGILQMATRIKELEEDLSDMQGVADEMRADLVSAERELRLAEARAHRWEAAARAAREAHQ